VKTAIIKTEIWKDKKIRQMHLDTKLLYLCLITNPDRNTTRFLKIDDDYISFLSGIDQRQLVVCREQLETLKLVYFIDDWAIYSDESYVNPAKGKLTGAIFDRDMSEIPENVIAYSDKLFLSHSCATQVYIDKDNNKDININNDIDNNNNYDQDGVLKYKAARKQLGL